VESIYLKKNDYYILTNLTYIMTNFFPINEDTFVDFCMRDIRAIGFDDWEDTYHQHIDHEVDNNSNEENIMIINQYAGGIYEAIELYKDEFGEFEYRSRKQFYAILAFISVYHKYYEIISDFVKSEMEEDEEEEELI
jgi:hypothetical protein